MATKSKELHGELAKIMAYIALKSQANQANDPGLKYLNWTQQCQEIQILYVQTKPSIFECITVSMSKICTTMSSYGNSTITDHTMRLPALRYGFSRTG